MSTAEPRRHVLVWVAAEFLESEGMLHILQESGAIPGQEQDWAKIVEAAENSGGFALGGKLVDPNHGAGIWISPLKDSGLEIMIPAFCPQCGDGRGTTSDQEVWLGSGELQAEARQDSLPIIPSRFTVF